MIINGILFFIDYLNIKFYLEKWNPKYSKYET